MPEREEEKINYPNIDGNLVYEKSARRISFGLKFFIFIFASLITLAIVASYAPVGELVRQISSIGRSFPEAKDPKQITLSCNFKGQTVSINETLQGSVYNYYGSDPKKDTLNRSNDYAGYVFSYPEDKTITTLATDIKSKGLSLKLTSDETLDLALCLVQAIPYDDAKAELILSHGVGDSVSFAEDKKMAGRFPYETLYDNKGICTDKSYLASSLIKEFGYGSVIYVFDKDRHMAVGIKTPSTYSSFSSGYSYIETTNIGYKVGQLPLIDTKNGLAGKLDINFSENDYKASGSSNIKDIPEIKEGNISAPSETVKISEGKEYERIIELTKRQARIKQIIASLSNLNKSATDLKPELESQKPSVEVAQANLSKAQQTLASAESQYRKNPTEGNYSAYEQAYSSYKTTYNSTTYTVNQYNTLVNNYNYQIDQFNKLVNEYNALIKLD
ncbi:hypothetical protein AUK11_04515 [bacterium CG2_30_37_16]|nr:MAG: hypothetical protein AUK11_04515 [bacterium CG2_30_37_16]PIP30766.1 MAG: hypothetical protein COX25_03005 [bacterium (Candidatus Howlettbacteria) CG23_combo_of_CG06-09_8_20_14_all_37_9]PIX98787.1 MAG: hypothetical protein COZ22_04170 [bacterium (Candidatus Howlettbacteria) CG_4_10_14_3_um_filter_37_10]PJB05485.1 MAG: hypothetical protein CO123_04000 [bacterium (Candidatus Howlettbacteria) CG_4_9_14_3_um_filter_37_10]